MSTIKAGGGHMNTTPPLGYLIKSVDNALHRYVWTKPCAEAFDLMGTKFVLISTLQSRRP